MVNKMTKESAVRIRLAKELNTWLQDYADIHSEGNLSQAIRFILNEKRNLLSSNITALGNKNDSRRQPV